MRPDSQRRSFIASLASLAALTAFGRRIPEAHAASHSPEMVSKWDITWLDSLKGKHRQVFDFGSRDLTVGGNPLRVPRNYLNALHELYGLGDSELSTLVGITSTAFPLNASDGLWADYSLGERWKIKDPKTGEWSLRNIWIDGTGVIPTASIGVLESRGTIFWQCNNALGGLADELATATGKKPDVVRADLTAGLRPTVKLVPAHTMLLGLAQEKGFTYEKL